MYMSFEEAVNWVGPSLRLAAILRAKGVTPDDLRQASNRPEFINAVLAGIGGVHLAEDPIVLPATKQKLIADIIRLTEITRHKLCEYIQNGAAFSALTPLQLLLLHQTEFEEQSAVSTLHGRAIGKNSHETKEIKRIAEVLARQARRLFMEHQSEQARIAGDTRLLSEFKAQLPLVYNRLAGADIYYLVGLCDWTEQDLTALPLVGPKHLGTIKALLASQGLALKHP